MTNIYNKINRDWPKILKKIREKDLNVLIKKRYFGHFDYLVPDSEGGKRILPLTFLDTVGCYHTLRGGCTMCNFNTRNKPSADYKKQMLRNAKRCFDYLGKTNKGYSKKIYHISTGGSFFDEQEVPYEVRKYILDYIGEKNKNNRVVFSTESRLEFINEKKIIHLRKTLGEDAWIVLGFGVESTNPLIREGCVFKKLPANLKEKIYLLEKYNIKRSIHVIVKPPFLTERESVEDVVKSVNDLFRDYLASSVVVMTMHSRPNTAVRFLEDKGMYSLPSIWTTVEIVRRLGPELCKKIRFNGFKFSSRTKYSNKINSVKGCKDCHHKIRPKIEALKNKTEEDWYLLIKEADFINCKCKLDWQKKMLEEPDQNLEDRIRNNLNYLKKELL